MGCFDGKVSVRGLCDVPTMEPLIYLDDVRLTLEDIEAFYDRGFANASEYFTSRYNFAVTTLENALHNHFSGNFTATTLVNDHRLGVYENRITSQISTADYVGIQLEFNPSDVYYKFELSEISLRLQHTGTVDVEVYDLLQNKLLAGLPLSSVSGEIVTGYLNELFYSSKRPMNLFIGYDPTGITSVKTAVKAGLCCGKRSCFNSYVTATGVEVTVDFYDSNVTSIDHTGGLSVVYSITCDHLSWLCAYSRQIALPLAYKTAEIMVSDALLNTSGERATNHHTINRDELAERYKFYQAKFSETFSDVISNMRMPSNKCFQCNSPIRHKAFAI